MITNPFLSLPERIYELKKPILKVSLQLILLEIIFIFMLQILLYTIPHQIHEIIYFFNINIYLIIAYLTWYSLKLSKVNRLLIIMLGIRFTVPVPYFMFFIFSQPNFSTMFNYINYHVLHIFISIFQLLITFYTFFMAVLPHKSSKQHIVLSLLFTLTLGIFNYYSMFTSGDYLKGYEALFERSYHIHIINLSLLIVFWHQYTQTKLIFSEYLSNILSVYTVIVGLEIFHTFSVQNNLIFHYFAQYFNAFLFIIIMVLWLLRLVYLQKPESMKNENYIENYYMLQGIIEKPRRGLFVEFYYNLNKNTLVIILGTMIILGLYLFLFDKFEVFIRLNLLILIIATIISAILAILTWHKRWYDAIGFFFKKRRINVFKKN